MSIAGPAPAPTFDPSHGSFEAFASIGVKQPADVLTQFAADNGLLYRPKSPGPAYPGSLFTTNTIFPFVYDHFSTTSGRYVDFGNFHTDAHVPNTPPVGLIGDSDPAPVDSWGFLAVQLDRQLPHMMLLSKHHVVNAAKLPMVPAQNQALLLEGDFDNYFTLYCPPEFQTDAFYIFTPDLMELLIDDAAPFDMEIADSWLFVYARKPFHSLDPAVYRRLFQILETVGRKIIGQTSDYQSAALAAVAPLVPQQPATWSFEVNPALEPASAFSPGQLRPKSQWPSMIIGLGVFAVIIGVVIFFASRGEL